MLVDLIHYQPPVMLDGTYRDHCTTEGKERKNRNGGMLLAYAELPGMYLQTDTLLLSVPEYIYCQLAKAESSLD